MPAFGTVQAGGIGAMSPGDLVYFFNNEAVAAGGYSVPIANQNGPLGSGTLKTFYGQFATVPSAAVVNVYSTNGPVLNTNDLVLAGVMTFGGSANEYAHDYTDQGNSAFYVMQVVSQTGGGNFTGSCQR